eukprot:tig00000808_g4418.t1
MREEAGQEAARAREELREAQLMRDALESFGDLPGAPAPPARPRPAATRRRSCAPSSPRCAPATPPPGASSPCGPCPRLRRRRRRRRRRRGQLPDLRRAAAGRGRRRCTRSSGPSRLRGGGGGGGDRAAGGGPQGLLAGVMPSRSGALDRDRRRTLLRGLGALLGRCVAEGAPVHADLAPLLAFALLRDGEAEEHEALQRQLLEEMRGRQVRLKDLGAILEAPGGAPAHAELARLARALIGEALPGGARALVSHLQLVSPSLCREGAEAVRGGLRGAAPSSPRGSTRCGRRAASPPPTSPPSSSPASPRPDPAPPRPEPPPRPSQRGPMSATHRP